MQTPFLGLRFVSPCEWSTDRGDSTALQEPEMALQLSRRQFLNAGIEGHQNTASFARLPEEHSIRPLSMSPDSGSHQPQSRGYLAIQGPEFMSCMAGGLA